MRGRQRWKRKQIVIHQHVGDTESVHIGEGFCSEKQRLGDRLESPLLPVGKTEAKARQGGFAGQYNVPPPSL